MEELFLPLSPLLSPGHCSLLGVNQRMREFSLPPSLSLSLTVDLAKHKKVNASMECDKCQRPLTRREIEHFAGKACWCVWYWPGNGGCNVTSVKLGCAMVGNVSVHMPVPALLLTLSVLSVNEVYWIKEAE
uniref:Uncharacterized protein n=1 Tax=Oryctolagus cuniculus TaxID=9986 RepID=A0A5F9CRE9_RABIT